MHYPVTKIVHMKILIAVNCVLSKVISEDNLHSAQQPMVSHLGKTVVESHAQHFGGPHRSEAGCL